MNVGQVIWSQLTIGTKMACGARQPLAGDDGLHFVVGRGTSTKIQIKINRGTDTYEVRRWFIRGANATVKEEQTDVYADSLNDVVYRMVNK